MPPMINVIRPLGGAATVSSSNGSSVTSLRKCNLHLNKMRVFFFVDKNLPFQTDFLATKYQFGCILGGSIQRHLDGHGDLHFGCPGTGASHGQRECFDVGRNVAGSRYVHGGSWQNGRIGCGNVNGVRQLKWNGKDLIKNR